MIDHKTHLNQIIEKQKTLSAEIQDLNTTLMIKKEQFLKYQGIVEYLSSNGITVETNENIEISQGKG